MGTQIIKGVREIEAFGIKIVRLCYLNNILHFGRRDIVCNSKIHKCDEFGLIWTKFVSIVGIWEVC